MVDIGGFVSNVTESAADKWKDVVDKVTAKKHDEEDDDDSTDESSKAGPVEPPTHAPPATAPPTSAPAMPLIVASPSSRPPEASNNGSSNGSPSKPPSDINTKNAAKESGGSGHAVGISVAVVACLLVVAAAVFIVRKRRAKSIKREKSLSSPDARTQNSTRYKNGTMMDDTTANYSHMPNTEDLKVHSEVTSRRKPSSSRMADHPEIQAVRIPMEKIELGQVLSRGGFGEVLLGTYKGQTVAIKRLLPERRKDLRQIDGFLTEAKMMATLEHERIVQFVGVAWDSLSEVCVVSEFMEGGDLRSVLSRWDSERRINGFDHDKIKIALHVAHAMTYLHSMQPIILHRDLKSKNILLNQDYDAKVTDFGVSRERNDATMTAGVGSSLWMAPEVMMGERYDEKADVFSFGVILSELDTHLLPYSHATEPGTGRKIPDTAILQMVTLGRLSIEFTNAADPDMVSLGRDCVAVDPARRPTAGEVLHRQLASKRAVWKSHVKQETAPPAHLEGYLSLLPHPSAAMVNFEAMANATESAADKFIHKIIGKKEAEEDENEKDENEEEFTTYGPTSAFPPTPKQTSPTPATEPPREPLIVAVSGSPPPKAPKESSRGGPSSDINTQNASNESGGSGHAVGISVAVVACLLVVAAAVFIVRKRRAKSIKREKSLSSPDARTQQSTRFKTGTITDDDATANYSHMPSTQDLVVAPRRKQSSSVMADHPEIQAVRIPMEKIELGQVLSRGGFGEVLLGTYKGQTVAIKRLLPERRKDLRQIDGFLTEAKMMATLEHERIVQFVGVAWDSLSEVCVVSEFMEGGDLRSVLSRWDSERRINGFDHDKIKIALHVAHAMTYLHSMQPIILHRDLKSKNILLNQDYDAKVTDFGVSRERNDATMTAGVGSSLWMAPEVMMGERYDEKADVFSFGVILSELDTHLLPYSHATEPGTGRKIPDTAILQMVTLGRLSIEFTNAADPDMVSLGRDCVAVDPARRPTAGEVLHRVHTVWRSCVAL